MDGKFFLTRAQIDGWNRVIQEAIDAGGYGLDLDFWEAMLIPPSESVTIEVEKPATQEEVNRLYLDNCPNNNCPVCVYLRGI